MELVRSFVLEAAFYDLTAITHILRRDGLKWQPAGFHRQTSREREALCGYLLLQPQPRFLGPVVFSAATVPCLLSTDNDGSERRIPAGKSGARMSGR